MYLTCRESKIHLIFRDCRREHAIGNRIAQMSGFLFSNHFRIFLLLTKRKLHVSLLLSLFKYSIIAFFFYSECYTKKKKKMCYLKEERKRKLRYYD